MNQSKNTVVLGLDVSSSSTGYAVVKSGRWRKTSGYFGKVLLPTDVGLSDKLVLFRDKLYDVLSSVRPTDIIIEDVFSGRNISTMKLLSRFNGVALEACCRFLNKPPMLALTAEVRSFLECGRGKEDAFNYICSRYNLDWSFHKMNDVTDAVALALYGHNILRKKV